MHMVATSCLIHFHPFLLSIYQDSNLDLKIQGLFAQCNFLTRTAKISIPDK